MVNVGEWRRPWGGGGWENKGIGTLLASKTTGTHVGFKVTDKNATFKLCPSSRFTKSSCLATLDQIHFLGEVVSTISSSLITLLPLFYLSFSTQFSYLFIYYYYFIYSPFLLLCIFKIDKEYMKPFDSCSTTNPTPVSYSLILLF